MEFKRAICPSCGGNLQLPPDRKTASCLYCGGELIVQDAINAAAQKLVPNLLSLANAARQAGNLDEAYRYYTQALEYEANDGQAWFGKALSAGEMSTVEASRIPEMIIGMQNALRATAGADKDRYRNLIAAAVVTVADRYLAVCRGNREKTFDWANFLNKCSEVLKALDFAYNLASDKKPIVKRILDILEENRAAYSSRKISVTSAFWMERESWLKSYRQRMRELTPAPPLVARTNSGSPISPEVLKVVGILGGVVVGGFILIILVVAIAGAGNPPSSRAQQPVSAPSASPSVSPTASPVPAVDQEALARKKAASDVAGYMKLLRSAGIDSSYIVDAKTGLTADTLKITVSNAWHYEPYQMRLQAAQKLWEVWAAQHSPNEPDKARISIVDFNDNEVGGSRVWAGSLIWVQET